MKTDTAHFLESVKELLGKQGIPSEISEKAIDNKIDTLWVPFEGTNLGLTLTYITPELMGREAATANVGLVQYHIAFPFTADKALMPAITEFIHRLNLFCPIPGWILDRGANAIHFRYVQLSGNTPPSEELVTYVFQIISFYMKECLPLLIDVVVGREKLDGAVAKLQAITR